MMLYLDSSVLVKMYFQEVGSGSMLRRIKAGGGGVATSVVSFAEVHCALARKHRERHIGSGEYIKLRRQFEKDWSNLVEIIDLDSLTLAALPQLVERFPLKAGDAIQLSTAIWLNGQLSGELGSGEAKVLEFAASDRILAGAARQFGLQVFNPEEEN